MSDVRRVEASELMVGMTVYEYAGSFTQRIELKVTRVELRGGSVYVEFENDCRRDYGLYESVEVKKS